MNISNKSTRNHINYKHDKRNDTYVSPSVSQSMFHEQNVFGKYERNREEKHVKFKVEVRSDCHKKSII